MVAASPSSMKQGRPSKTASIEAVSQERAAALPNVSRASVQRAEKIKSFAEASLIKAVEDGKIAVSVAAKLAEALSGDAGRNCRELGQGAAHRQEGGPGRKGGRAWRALERSEESLNRAGIKRSRCQKKGVAQAIGMLLGVAINYLAVRAQTVREMSGVSIGGDDDWERIFAAIDAVVDAVAEDA